MEICAFLTLGQVASTTAAPIAANRASSLRGMPWARTTTVISGSASSAECSTRTPLAAYSANTWGLWMMAPSVATRPGAAATASSNLCRARATPIQKPALRARITRMSGSFLRPLCRKE